MAPVPLLLLAVVAGKVPGLSPGPPAARRRGSHTVRWAMAGLAVALAATLAVLAGRLGKDATLVPSPLVGKPAPAFTLTNLDGTRLTNADLAGKPYAVNFWASWCVPCRQEHGNLRAFWERHRGQGVGLLGVLYGDTPAAARAFQRELGGDWPLFEANQAATVDFGVRGPPETFLVDGKGIIVAKFTGPVGPGQLDDALVRETRPSGG